MECLQLMSKYIEWYYGSSQLAKSLTCKQLEDTCKQEITYSAPLHFAPASALVLSLLQHLFTILLRHGALAQYDVIPHSPVFGGINMVGVIVSAAQTLGTHVLPRVECRLPHVGLRH